MKLHMFTATATAAGALSGLLSFGAEAQQGTSGELVPYFWAVGADGDAEVRGREVDVDADFNDVKDNLEFGGSILGVLHHNRLAFWGQLDYINLKNDDLGGNIDGELETKAMITTLAAGYQFGGWRPGQTFDVMLGARMLALKLDLDVGGIGSTDSDEEFFDAVVVVRPSLPLSARWRFNPTASVGAGDSDLTWELWPQFEYAISDTWVTRVGYRTLTYDIDGDNGNSWDASFTGFTLGLGGKF